jgi:hypothetical protein
LRTTHCTSSEHAAAISPSHIRNLASDEPQYGKPFLKLNLHLVTLSPQQAQCQKTRSDEERRAAEQFPHVEFEENVGFMPQKLCIRNKSWQIIAQKQIQMLNS